MNYYKRGDAANADKIKAAFEARGFIPRIAPIYYGSEGVLFFTDEENYICETSSPWIMNIIKTHPDYQELELPVESKFKVHDWIVRWDGAFTMSIESLRDGSYHFNQGGSLPIKEVDECYHLWTIADAKDGDVLATDGIICIFKKLDKDGCYIISPCIYTIKDGLEVIDDEDDSIGSCGFKPATKEDRELLFRKMKEAGYEWDKKKKELKKIKVHYDISNFYAGMPVLVRETNLNAWQYVLFSHCYIGGDGLTRFNAGLVGFTQCIPFNEKTKHLLGTTDMPSEEYINW